MNPQPQFPYVFFATIAISLFVLGCGPTSSGSLSSDRPGSSRPAPSDNNSTEPEDITSATSTSEDRAPVATDDEATTASDIKASDDTDAVPTPASSKTSPTKSTSGTTSSNAEPWGHFRGQFIYDGDPPPPSNVTITKDREFCGKHDVLNETLVVNSGDGGLANVAIYLYLKRGSDPPPVHPSYEETTAAKVTLVNEKCRFEPHVCLLRTSQTLVIGNKDAVGHNTKIDALFNASINPITPAGQSLEHQFPNEERSPIGVSCSIHTWMSAWVVVRDNPYFAVTDANGNFEIKNLPAGEWTFMFWHEKSRGIREVKLYGKATQWKLGRAEVTITAGQVTDWGQVEVSPELFKD